MSLNAWFYLTKQDLQAVYERNVNEDMSRAK